MFKLRTIKISDNEARQQPVCAAVMSKHAPTLLLVFAGFLKFTFFL